MTYCEYCSLIDDFRQEEKIKKKLLKYKLVVKETKCNRCGNMKDKLIWIKRNK